MGKGLSKDEIFGDGIIREGVLELGTLRIDEAKKDEEPIVIFGVQFLLAINSFLDTFMLNLWDIYIYIYETDKKHFIIQFIWL